ncbi:phytanoyl-CoA dioxygenase family protein [Paragemmobacter ruber]|uniref:Phytanoyl-CoA dioxygenase n=1 Tax=Paragemmobacter ruber TaxID=1985673 RepID=A0ABW9Y684_9RHOB|nr:phytanoyl-CoA dioxygenase family protein [Rhodobacter ruber]NBE07325.1 phytanoyl-CoA dioxygenase [Rhodobacter ruber]
MLNHSTAAARTARVYLRAEDCRLEDLATLCSQAVSLADYPFAADVQKNVLIYDCPALLPALSSPDDRRALMAEWAEAMLTGPGVVVLKGAEPDLAMIDEASAIFWRLIAEQNRAGTGGGDHFAKPGANDRLWNSLEKHCLADPANFARYYANPFLAAISEAWLGPHYQITAQLNVVNPGGAAQSPHRDYHLGFQSAAQIESYPRHVQLLSPVLTLQGAIAHVDATIETGPTQLLPFSQAYDAGYLAMNRPDFRAFFVENHVQLPLSKGDMLFFSPALLHAAGTNRSADIRRMVNLFQVSSAYGRAMETVDRNRMTKALYPTLRAAKRDGSLTPGQIAHAIAASAEGYSFPTNLDRDPPLGGMAPKTQAALVAEALAADWNPEELNHALDEQAAKKRS